MQNRTIMSIDCHSCANNCVFQKFKDGYEIISSGAKTDILGHEFVTEVGEKVNIVYDREEKRRKDSPLPTKIYRILVDGSSYSCEKNMVEMIVVDGVVTLRGITELEVEVFEEDEHE